MDSDERQPRYGRRWRNQMRNELAQRYGGRCCWCGDSFSIIGWATIEHLVPLSHGGTNDIENLRLACRECNNDRDLWYQIQLGTVREGKKRFWSCKERRYVKRDEFAAV